MTDSPEVFGSPRGLAKRLGPGIEREILRLVVSAYNRWKGTGFRRYDNNEPSLTVRLVKFFREESRQLNSSFDAYCEVPNLTMDVLDGKSPPTTASRVDILVQWSHYSEDDTYTIECKRLDSSQHPKRYVDEGIMRFVNRKYAEQFSLGAMVGFVRESDAGAAALEINRVVAGNPNLGHAAILRKQTTDLPIDHEYLSQHTRNTGYGDITLTHLLFELDLT